MKVQAVDEGHATFGAEALRIMRLLDSCFLSWADQTDAEEIEFPPIAKLADLRKIDYFQNFPHLGLAVSALRTDKIRDDGAEGFESQGSLLSVDTLQDAAFLLPSAACYPIYSHLRDQLFSAPKIITTKQRCYRNEAEYVGLARLCSFKMREVVIVGERHKVIQFLAAGKEWVSHFAETIGVDLEVKPATDPFFESDGPRKQMQKLFPTKEEFLYGGEVAVSSLNFHRNFFGERWKIRTGDGGYAFSGCIAFGLERWLHALINTYKDNWNDILSAVEAGLVTPANPQRFLDRKGS